MRILLIHQYFLEDHDGGGSRWNEMSRIWTQAGHEVTVLAGMVHYMGGRPEEYKGKYFVRKTNKDRVEVIRCHVSESYNQSFSGRLRAYFSFTFSSIRAGLFKVKGPYDLIIVTSPPLFVGITALVLSWWKKTPFIFEVRDLWPESAIDTGVLTNKQLIRFAYWFEKIIYQKACRINVLTPAFRDKLIMEKRVSPEKIIFIPNAADFAISEEVMRSFNSDRFRKEHALDGKFVITYVGAHGVANHLVQLLDAAEMLGNTPVYFLLIGDGMQKKMLMADAEKRKITNIRFVDPVSKREVFKYILASDMGISVLKNVATFKTIYSNKTFDYFSCKKPVLIAIDGISRQLVEEADAGMYIEPENTGDFVNKILFCSAHPETIKQQGENGYTFARKHFDRGVLAKRYLEYIEEAIRKI
ncbi:hypothetical protein DYBT9275_04525 [Dyadobacter sp. CECT 9275]|uniref:Glycosyltransferase WbuB n=1 Tax=Dyadobacter helix TaxID=2822344 RepID=A0A916JGV3_9BACT|nr:glycosyltransferase family 4 protein [Dyadobacter sp. CECT 9275]CAG5009560.1 hypothetical protein DYBT9275_04525 [Dyadobacter sp. CECT 9275]